RFDGENGWTAEEMHERAKCCQEILMALIEGMGKKNSISGEEEFARLTDQAGREELTKSAKSYRASVVLNGKNNQSSCGTISSPKNLGEYIAEMNKYNVKLPDYMLNI
ncbi:MAG: hypothetical protein LBJ16_02695, partial [Holosporaceae bacterium]|nr:hypothetical protein [Holosporaceae bacterium]